MTRARLHTSGVGNQPFIQPLLEAVLCALVMIVSNVAAMFGMSRRSEPRDWHTQDTENALPQTKPDIQFKEPNSGPPGPNLAALKRSESGPAVDAQRRTQTLTRFTNLATSARQEADVVRVAREGGHPVLREAQTHIHRSALTRADQTPACAGVTVERVAPKIA